MKRPKPNSRTPMNYLTIKKTPTNSLLLLEAMALNFPTRFIVVQLTNPGDGKEYFEVRHFQGEEFSQIILNYINENNVFKIIQTFTGLPTD